MGFSCNFRILILNISGSFLLFLFIYKFRIFAYLEQESQFQVFLFYSGSEFDMIRIFIILSLIILIVLVVFNYAVGKIKNFINSIVKQSINQNRESSGNADDGNVVYKKDDVVVLKGEAGKESKKEGEQKTKRK